MLLEQHLIVDEFVRFPGIRNEREHVVSKDEASSDSDFVAIAHFARETVMRRAVTRLWY